MIEQVLEAIGICQLGVAGFEADDVIATLAVREPGPVDIVTGDRDLFQLVDDAKPVRIVYTARGVGKADVIDEAAVSARYGIPGRSYADFAALRGDPERRAARRPRHRRQDRCRACVAIRLAHRTRGRPPRGYGGRLSGRRPQQAQELARLPRGGSGRGGDPNGRASRHARRRPAASTSATKRPCSP